MIQIYGIANCDSVKKARTLLDARGVSYTFYDYKKQGVPEPLLRQWVAAKGWQVLLNRKGTSWRALDERTKSGVVDAESAIRVMLANASTIKRPVIVDGDEIGIGVPQAASNQTDALPAPLQIANSP